MKRAPCRASPAALALAGLAPSAANAGITLYEEGSRFLEVSGAWRQGGWSVDAEANIFSAETRNGSFTGGIVDNGDAGVRTTSVEGGYLIAPRAWEVVASLAAEEADAWDETETQAGVGVNYFISGNKNKLQVSLVKTADSEGVNGADVTDLYVQLQHAF